MKHSRRHKHDELRSGKPPPVQTTGSCNRLNFLSTCINCATLRRPWWTIPETERLQMHAFTRPSPQLRLKVRNSLLLSLHYSSLYMRFIIANKEKGARTKIVGHALHTKLTHSPLEGKSLLEFKYWQLYIGKLAKIYGHALTNECPLCRMRTHVHILPGNERHMTLYASAATMRHASSSMHPSARLQRGEGPSIARRT
jgi:hypothetical protein